ncbi:hypothetical protein PICMEDRAFT_17936 [Pichia membranifaciens NRRL Y-2026]|uniref:Uncharacterized protein n=1 Tax=Pichia membranifaciens NRRL Y-2026 TaxID=763406 RepID=A0A1E3NIQ8_9ASCO|nr:hypothetical protein PICMEDRAFT_17936 [Pichia membranifaciens NRRL Y-2026]ODQ45468.1 hypothetical protein PICMEDRAFT_17936 [Pichia membranifaciens NRRL Y-2026]
MGRIKGALTIGRSHVPELVLSRPSRTVIPLVIGTPVTSLELKGKTVCTGTTRRLCDTLHLKSSVASFYPEVRHSRGLYKKTVPLSECIFMHNSAKDNILKEGGGNDGEGSSENRAPEINKNRLERKANLGTIIQMLQFKIPNMLTDLLPPDFVSDKIILKVLPHQFPNLPTFRGYLLYSSTLKAIQKILLMFYLNPDSKIHISDIKIIEPTNSMSSDELINLSIDSNHLENESLSENSAPRQDTSKYTTKVKVKWRTCYSGCEHLQDAQTTDAKWGSYSLDHFDWTKLLKSPNPLQTISLLEAKKTIEGLAKTLDPLKNISQSTGDSDNANNQNRTVGRILTGVFVFELDAPNEHIMVFTIDNMEILESKQTNFVNGCLA